MVNEHNCEWAATQAIVLRFMCARVCSYLSQPSDKPNIQRTTHTSSSPSWMGWCSVFWNMLHARPQFNASYIILSRESNWDFRIYYHIIVGRMLWKKKSSRIHNTFQFQILFCIKFFPCQLWIEDENSPNLFSLQYKYYFSLTYFILHEIVIPTWIWLAEWMYEPIASQLARDSINGVPIVCHKLRHARWMTNEAAAKVWVVLAQREKESNEPNTPNEQFYMLFHFNVFSLITHSHAPD